MTAKNPATGPWFSGESDDTNPQPSVDPKVDQSRGKDPVPELDPNVDTKPTPKGKG